VQPDKDSGPTRQVAPDLLVSTEQAVMRTCLVTAAALGAVALRLVNRRRASDTRSHSGT